MDKIDQLIRKNNIKYIGNKTHNDRKAQSRDLSIILEGI